MSEAISTQEKIEYIEKTRSFGEIRQAWFPPSASTEYYFVSYCHSDYKAVFKDIFGMQQADPAFSVWYDRELVAGKDWKAEAQKHIYDFNCKGVIFYVSENSVKSPAVLEEMKMTRDAKKLFVPIVLPTESGEYFSGEKLFERDRSIILDRTYALELYRTMLGKDITYLKLSDESSYKVEAVKKSLKGLPLLKFGLAKIEPEDDDDAYDTAPEVVACRNISVVEIGQNDFVYDNKKLNAYSWKLSIGNCAFANCSNLIKVELPLTTAIINQYAFFGCHRLKSINIRDNGYINDIGDNAFAQCSSLEEIDLPLYIARIQPRTFEGCKSLRHVRHKAKIMYVGEYAFAECESLESFDFAYTDKHAHYQNDDDAYLVENYICNDAFNGCISLKSIKLPLGLTEIGERAFYNCSSLESVEFSETLIEVGGLAFGYCTSLKSVDLTRRVTKAQFEKATKDSAVAKAWEAGGVTTIKACAFGGCSSLTSIYLPQSLKTIFWNAFTDSAIKDIYYEGTVKQWEAIKKYKKWDEGTPDYTVHCSDGKVSKSI